MKRAFTLIELIFVIVIIGVLASFAIPRFSGLVDSSKKSAELSTASSIQVSIDSCHGEWIINEGSFICGKDIDGENDLTDDGYPKNSVMGNDDDHPIDKILKNGTSTDWKRTDNKYFGPTNPEKDSSKRYWEYNESDGSFVLKNN